MFEMGEPLCSDITTSYPVPTFVNRHAHKVGGFCTDKLSHA